MRCAISPACRSAARAGGADDDLPAVARRLSADRRVHRQVVHLQRRRPAGYYWLAIIGVLSSVVSVFYYLRIMVMMYMTDGHRARAAARAAAGGHAGLALAAVAVFYLGILPTRVIELASIRSRRFSEAALTGCRFEAALEVAHFAKRLPTDALQSRPRPAHTVRRSSTTRSCSMRAMTGGLARRRSADSSARRRPIGEGHEPAWAGRCRGRCRRRSSRIRR